MRQSELVSQGEVLINAMGKIHADDWISCWAGLQRNNVRYGFDARLTKFHVR
ncbi:hypothetical protein [Pseudomonas sp. CCOS 191]|uniref:hypothetical protein n=1 Tax=Pseudomonas sp. CCOS 191 TaxID=1649877 RepID=UPI0006243F21|nr:hypothetical protein [Pseudomonas sp. CCOS 191]CRI56994.1 hypothetical protein CCOS191_2458 [Pseudomonas sp. CCOS 191]